MKPTVLRDLIQCYLVHLTKQVEHERVPGMQPV